MKTEITVTDNDLMHILCKAMRREFRAMEAEGIQFTAEWPDEDADLLWTTTGGRGLLNFTLGRLIERHGEDFSLSLTDDNGVVANLDVFRQKQGKRNQLAVFTFRNGAVVNFGWEPESGWQMISRKGAAYAGAKQMAA